MKRQEFRTGSTRLYDDTAYKALSHIENEEDRTGELWEIEMNGGVIKEAIVLSDHGNLCQVIILTDDWNEHCDIELHCRGERYGCSRMLQYTFNNRIAGFIRKLTDEEFEDIQLKVAESLGLVFEEAEDEDTAEEVKPLMTLGSEGLQIYPVDDLELERTKAQLEVYKNMYNDLLQMTLKGAV